MSDLKFKIYTSYFANVRNLPKDTIPISISLYPPKGWTGLKYPPLYPPQELLFKAKHDQVDNREYILTYTHQVLDKLDKNQVLMDISELMNSCGANVACLICYEKPTDFCHRKIIQKWLDITEWSSEEYIQEETLF